MNAMATESLSVLHPTYHCNNKSFKDAIKIVVSDILPLILEKSASKFKLSAYVSTKKIEIDYPFSAASSIKQNGGRHTNKEKHNAYLIVELFRQLKMSSITRSEKFLDLLVSEIQSVDVLELKRLAFQLLCQIIPELEPNSPTTRRFCNDLMIMYTISVVGMEPAKPQDWDRSKEFDELYPYLNCTSKCYLCPAVKEFFENTYEESQVFPGTAFLHIPYVSESFITWQKQGENWILRKTNKTWERKYEGWQRRAQAAQNLFQELAQDKLKEILGEQLGPIMNLNVVKLNQQSNNSAETGMDASNEDEMRPKKRLRS